MIRAYAEKHTWDGVAMDFSSVLLSPIIEGAPRLIRNASNECKDFSLLNGTLLLDAGCGNGKITASVSPVVLKW